MNVRLEHLGHRYGAVEALRDVTAEARAGNITAIVGPNASGKSTLIRGIIGAIRPQWGAAFIDNLPVASMSARQLARRAAYVPQRSVVAAAFTVREVVELGRYALPRDVARIEEALARLELTDLAARPYPALSVGQQQRVTMARALAQLPERGLLVLDEPTAAMDLRHAERCMKLLREIADAGGAVVVAMHDLSMAALWADEAWLLDDGRLAASGPAEEVLAPDRLEAVFGVGFERVGDSEGRFRLLASSPRA
ncbi:MAG: ABC transporter ATP-binding protein [Phycisphaerales bacterium]|nr:MAG: ABC transporter ATP-binding protein [Phycisphaerales bacterium]